MHACKPYCCMQHHVQNWIEIQHPSIIESLRILHYNYTLVISYKPVILHKFMCRLLDHLMEFN